MSDDIDQLSFASILAGVQKMRQDYEITVPEQTSRNKNENLDKALEKSSVHIEEVNVQESQRNENPGNVNNVATSKNGTTSAARPQIPLVTNQAQSLRSANRRGANTNVHSYKQVQVAHSQKGNPLLESPHMKLTPWTYNGLILLDYYINATVQVLFLSLKYHKLRPEYVWRRLEKLKGGTSTTNFEKNDEALRVLLVVVDIDSPQEVLRKLSVMCIKNDLTMVVCWSFEEAGNYVAALKLNEMARTKLDLAIQGTKKNDYNSNIVNSLATVRAVNKTDVANLLANCKSFKNIVLLSTQGDGLLNIQGLGGRKVTNLNNTFSEPFVFNKEW